MGAAAVSQVAEEKQTKQVGGICIICIIGNSFLIG